MPKLAIIEDHKAIAEMLSLYFEKQEDFELIFCVGSAEEIPMEKIKQLDLVLCDIGLPGKSGGEITQEIKQENPDVRVVMLTVFEDEEKIFEALKSGASGYLLKTTPLPEIKEGLLETLKDGAAISPAIAKKVIDYFKLTENIPQKNLSNLTPREFIVFSNVQTGLSNKEIAHKLSISLPTVKFHVKNIFDKLQVKNRKEFFDMFTK